MKTETEKAANNSDLFPNSLLMKETPGANMEEASGETKVIAEMRKRSMNFLDCWKFSGMVGSSCPSHPTILSWRFCSGIVCRGIRSFVVDMRESTREILLPPVSDLLKFPGDGPDFIEPCV